MLLLLWGLPAGHTAAPPPPRHSASATASPATNAAAAAAPQVLEKLMRAHGCRSSDELLELADEAAERLEQFYAAEGDAEAWQQELEQLAARLAQVGPRRSRSAPLPPPAGVPASAALAEPNACAAARPRLQEAVELSRRRREAAEQLRASVDQCLGELAMGASRFGVRLHWEAAGGGSYGGSVARCAELGEELAGAAGQPGGRWGRGGTPGAGCAPGSRAAPQPPPEPAAPPLPSAGPPGWRCAARCLLGPHATGLRRLPPAAGTSCTRRAWTVPSSCWPPAPPSRCARWPQSPRAARARA